MAQAREQTLTREKEIEDVVLNWELLKASGPTDPYTLKQKYDELPGNDRLSIEDQVRVLHTLNSLDLIETSDELGFTLKPVQNPPLDTEDLIDNNIPEWSELKEDLVHEKVFTSKKDHNFYQAKGKSHHINLELMPSEYALEHFSRYEDNVAREEDKDYEVISAVRSGKQGVMDEVMTFENDYENQKTTVQLGAKIKLPRELEAMFSSQNMNNYLASIKNKRLETLVSDVENIYNLAEETVNNGVEREDGYAEIEDIVDDLNHKRRNLENVEEFETVEEALDWAHQNSLNYYCRNGQKMSATPFIQPIARFLQEGRERGTDMAHYSNKYSKSELKRKRQDKGEAAIDLYFETIKKLV